MERSRYLGGESRHRKKGPGHEVDDQRGSHRNRHGIVTSGTPDNGKGIIVDGNGDLQKPPVSRVYSPDDLVEKWLAETTKEPDMPLNSRIGFMERNGRLHL
jgi:hypothetical protein